MLTASAEDNRYTYTGREWDEVLGLYHFRARMYDATEGRFCSRDKVKYADHNNQYAFLRLHVLSYLDPSWLDSIEDDIGHIGACIRSKIETEIRVQMTEPPFAAGCDRHPLEVVLDGQLAEGLRQLSVEIVMAMIAPIFPGAETGQLGQVVTQELLDILTEGDPGISEQEVQARILNALRDRAREAGLSWTNRQLISIAESLTQFRNQQQAGETCGTVTSSTNTDFSKSSNCTFNVCGKPGTNGKDTGVTFRITGGVCNYKCERKGLQICCCGKNRTTFFTGRGSAGIGECAFAGRFRTR